MSSETVLTTAVPGPRGGIPGRYVVMAMFGFGVLATVTIFVYWDLHTRPFRPLTEAIGREFVHSVPKVEGGSHKGSPMTLRIAIRVPFEPNAATVETQQVVNRLVGLAQAHADLNRFEELHIHIFQRAPERLARQASFEYPMAAVRDKLPFDAAAAP